jgi:hypothetical protein
MPPSPPAPGCSEYQNPRYLSTAEKQTISLWAKSGAPAGDPSGATPYQPPPPVLGTPDKHLPTGPFTPTYPGTAGPDDLYWCFIVDPGVAVSTDLTAIGLDPDDTAQVHHIIVFRDPGGTGAAGKPAAGFECDGVPGEMLSGWVPGNWPLKLPDGVGMTLEPTDRLLVQVHFHRHDGMAPKPVSPKLDLFFSPQKTPEHAWVVWAGTPAFEIPANTRGYAVPNTCTVSDNWKVIGVAPHMHQHATKFTAELQTASAGNQCLVNIARWAFEWQGSYVLKNPIDLKPGDKIQTSCIFDNTTASPVPFGESTGQEMCIGFTWVVAPSKPIYSGLLGSFGFCAE